MYCLVSVKFHFQTAHASLTNQSVCPHLLLFDGRVLIYFICTIRNDEIKVKRKVNFPASTLPFLMVHIHQINWSLQDSSPKNDLIMKDNIMHKKDTGQIDEKCAIK